MAPPTLSHTPRADLACTRLVRRCRLAGSDGYYFLTQNTPIQGRRRAHLSYLNQTFSVAYAKLVLQYPIVCWLSYFLLSFRRSTGRSK